MYSLYLDIILYRFLQDIEKKNQVILKGCNDIESIILKYEGKSRKKFSCGSGCTH